MSHRPQQRIQNLATALKGILESFLIIYVELKPYFKVGAMLLLVLIAYKLGRYSAHEPIAKKVKKLTSSIQQKQQQRLEGPRQILSLKEKLKSVAVLLIFLLGGMGAATYLNYLAVRVEIWVGVSLVGFLLLVSLFVRRKYLIEGGKKLGEKERQIREGMKQLMEMMGKKVQNNLRTTLCRDKILAHSKVPTNVCSKKDCQQLRKQLAIRYEAIRSLAESALTFEWCSVCKKKQPFDEFLSYEQGAMLENPSSSEEEQVENRVQYLMQECERMMKWIRDVAPCNCSKLYIEDILKEKKKFGRIERETTEAINRCKGRR